MKLFKRSIFLIFSIFIIISCLNIVKADSDLYLNSLDFNVQINSDGSMDVTEIWDIDIEDTNTLFKTFERDSSKYTAITDGKVSKINSDGTETEFIDANQYYYHVPTGEYYFLKRGSNYEVAWGTGHEYSSGTEKYKISYHIEDAICIYNDCSEMYWQFVGSDFEIAAKKITGTIKLPEEVENIEDLRVWGHTPDLNGTINKTSNDTVEFTINNNKINKMVEVRIAMPNGVVSSSGRVRYTNKLQDIIDEETSWANEANSTRMTKIIIITVICLVIFGFLIYFLVRNILILKNTVAVVPSTHYDYYRDLARPDATPAEAAYIEENKYSGFDTSEFGKIFSATLLSLSLKKAIKISQYTNQSGKEDTLIEIICNDINNVTNKQDEILIFEFIRNACNSKVRGLFGNNENTNSNQISFEELKKYISKYQSKVVSLKSELDTYMKSNLINRNILDKEGIKKRTSMFLSGCLSTFIIFFIFFFISNVNIITTAIDYIGIPYFIILIMIVFIIADIVIENKAKDKISVYTQQGVDEQDKWKAFKKYMEDFSLLKEKEIPDLVLWEKFLVYATAFGISEKVIKQLKIVYPDYNTIDYNIYPSMYMCMNTDFNKSFNSISNSMSSSFSSGSGGGGGFSGRRWPAAEAGGGGGGR